MSDPANTPPQRPAAILIVGGPGSGKSTLSRIFANEGLLRIDPDAVRENLPEYPALMHSGVDVVAQTSEQTNQLTDAMLEKAIREGAGFVFDASGRDREWYLWLIRRLMQSGFETTVILAYCRPQVARRRCDQRAAHNGRRVSAGYFELTHTSIPGHFLHYAQAADRFLLVRTDTPNPACVWWRTAAGDIVLQPGFLEEFMDQAAAQSGLADSLPGSFAPRPTLASRDPWFEGLCQRMHSLPSWDLSLETIYHPEH